MIDPPTEGSEERDAGHHLLWVSVKDDSMLGASLTALITPIVRGKKGSRGKTVQIPLIRYRYAQAEGKPISWYMPTTDADTKKFNRSGDRFKMPGTREQ